MFKIEDYKAYLSELKIAEIELSTVVSNSPNGAVNADIVLEFEREVIKTIGELIQEVERYKELLDDWKEEKGFYGF